MKAKTNRWHPVMLPDDYLRKMKQDMSEVEAQVESKIRYEPDPDFSPPPAAPSPEPVPVARPTMVPAFVGPLSAN